MKLDYGAFEARMLLLVDEVHTELKKAAQRDNEGRQALEAFYVLYPHARPPTLQTWICPLCYWEYTFPETSERISWVKHACTSAGPQG